MVVKIPNCLHINTENVDETGSRGGGGNLIFSYIRRLGSILGIQNFEFQYFWGFSEK